MFKLIGIAVVFMLIFKFGKRLGGGKKAERIKDEFREETGRIKRKMSNTIETTKRYFYETTVDEKGKKTRKIRAVEEIDEDEYRSLKDEVC